MLIKVLFVCLGNICRSPMAQFVFKKLVEDEKIDNKFEIDSAGIEAFNEINHLGIHHGTKNIFHRMNIPFEEHYARRVRKSDYKKYDYILAMDRSNIDDLIDIFGSDPESKIHLLLDYTTKKGSNIKDPWYTGNFDETYQDILYGCKSFLNWLTTRKKI